MGLAEIVGALVVLANNAGVLSNLYSKMQSEGRTELTPEEMATVRNAAVEANNQLREFANG